jgi:xanthine dehydrogenase accessory factor
MQEILRQTQAMLATGEPFALVTLIGEEGSTPRAAGAEMLVRSDGSIAGTVGGGMLEATAIKEARAAIEDRSSSLLTMELKGHAVEDQQMLCGGRARLLVSFVPASDPELSGACSALLASLESGRSASFITLFRCVPDSGCTVSHAVVEEGRVTSGMAIEPADVATLAASHEHTSRLELRDGREVHTEQIEPPPMVLMCGAGHVGQAVAPVAAGVGFDVAVIDDRPEFASAERFPATVRLIVPPDLDHAFASVRLGERSYVIVATRGHTHDFTILQQALRSPAAYIGLMASSRKRRRFFETLLERGFTQADIERIHSPVGLAIGAETPAELAVSIVAELVKVRAELRH